MLLEQWRLNSLISDALEVGERVTYGALTHGYESPSSFIVAYLRQLS
jgi:AraC-like DNA-binding protein